MKLNRKLWTAALAVAMTTPSAMAAQDTAGMHYTSASEGFYASIRLRYVSNGGDKDGAGDIQNSSSRIGVRGDNDLGGGLEGFYQYEMQVGTEDGDTGGMKTRVAHVGLRGDFGSVVAGAFWPDTYNWVYGATDVANRSSGNITGNLGQYRTSKSLQYTTPDLNGFRGAILVKADSSSDGEGGVGDDGDKIDIVKFPVIDRDANGVATLTTTFDNQVDKVGNPKDDNDVDHWSLAATYDIAGFSMGASYSVYPDKIASLRSGYISGHLELADSQGLIVVPRSGGIKKDDLTAWAVKLGYSQDNWYVNSWYGQESTSDVGGLTALDADGDLFTSPAVEDTKLFSIAGGISVDKVAVYAVYETKEHSFFGKPGDLRLARGNDSYHTLGVQYTLGSNSWTWVEYAGRDFDSSENEDGDFSIGLGHSF